MLGVEIRVILKLTDSSIDLKAKARSRASMRSHEEIRVWTATNPEVSRVPGGRCIQYVTHYILRIVQNLRVGT